MQESDNIGNLLYIHLSRKLPSAWSPDIRMGHLAQHGRPISEWVTHLRNGVAVFLSSSHLGTQPQCRNTGLPPALGTHGFHGELAAGDAVHGGKVLPNGVLEGQKTKVQSQL